MARTAKFSGRANNPACGQARRPHALGRLRWRAPGHRPQPSRPPESGPEGRPLGLGGVGVAKEVLQHRVVHLAPPVTRSVMTQAYQ